MVHSLIFVRIPKAWPMQTFLLIWDTFFQRWQVGYIRVSKAIEGYCHQAVICYGINYSIIPTKKVKELFLILKYHENKKVDARNVTTKSITNKWWSLEIGIISYASPKWNSILFKSTYETGWVWTPVFNPKIKEHESTVYNIHVLYRLNYNVKPFDICTPDTTNTSPTTLTTKGNGQQPSP